MFLTDKKLERRIDEIEQYRYRDIIEVRSFTAAEEEQGVVNPKLPAFHNQGTENGTYDVDQSQNLVGTRFGCSFMHMRLRPY